MTATLPATNTITPSELQQLQTSDPLVQIVDVRTGGEYESAHIPGSHNVPLDTLTEHARAFADVERELVLVCQSGGRASLAHDKLSTAGKQGVHILDGGMAEWQQSGGDVAQGATKRWAMDRQVRLVAGSLVLGSVLASVALPRLKWLAAGVGGGLTFSAVSNTCAMASVLAKLPYNRGSKCDINGIIKQLNAS